MSGASDLKHTAAKRHLLNEKTTETEREIKRKIKGVVIILFQKALKIPLVKC